MTVGCNYASDAGERREAKGGGRWGCIEHYEYVGKYTISLAQPNNVKIFPLSCRHKRVIAITVEVNVNNGHNTILFIMRESVLLLV